MHAASNFYGYRGEWPGKERFVPADYSGFAGFGCARVVLHTAAPKPISGGVPLKAAVAPHGQGGVRLSVAWPSGVTVRSVVWQDSMNNTIAAVAPVGQDSAELEVPCFCGCTGQPACDHAQRFSVRVLAADGSHSRAGITLDPIGNAMWLATVDYKQYLPAGSSFSTTVESSELDLGGGLTSIHYPAASDNAVIIVIAAAVAVVLVAAAVGVGLWYVCHRRRQRQRVANGVEGSSQLWIEEGVEGIHCGKEGDKV